MKEVSQFLLSLVGLGVLLYLAVANLELTAILVAAIFISALIKRSCGPMADCI